MKVTGHARISGNGMPLVYIGLLLFLFVFSSGWASVNTYIFNSSLSTYAEISGGTILGSTANDNQNFDAIPLGFTFVYDGVGYNNVSVQTNGFLGMGNIVTNSTVPISSATGTNNIVAALARDIKSRDTGELMYLLSGAAPNRVFTVQWKHYRRTPTVAANDDFSFQIHLQESGNKVVFAYGTFNAVTSVTSASIQVGLRGSSNTDFNNRATTTDWSATTSGIANNNNCTLSSTVFPTNGLTYTWSQNLDLLNPAINPSPSFAAENVSIDTNLTWQNGGGTPAGYKLYLGTNNPPSNIANGDDLGLATTYDPISDLQQNTTYFWRITPYDVHGDLAGCPIWSFTTVNPPLPATIGSPADGATGIEINATLNWTAGAGFPNGYKVYFGTNNPPTNIVNGTIQTATAYDPTPDMVYNTTYYWQIIPFTSGGDAANCPVWSFTAKDQAMPAINPSPANNAANVSIQRILTWQSGGGNPTGYRVYLGTDNPPTNMVNGTSQTATTFDPDLLYNTTYYWKIVPFNQYGNAISSPIWTFTTINPVQISATSLDFGTVQIGQSSSYQQIIITDASDTDNLTVQDITLSGANPAEFEFVNTSTLPLILLPNQTITVQVRYTPQSGGEKQAVLHLIINSQSYEVSLVGSSTIFVNINAGIGGTAWGDYDSDGDLDVLSGSGVYCNDGNNTFTDINSGIGGTAWGDFNNDGDLDILSGGAVYRNNGDATFTDINAGLMGLLGGKTAWGDYDNDGDLDILLAGEVEPISNTYMTKIYRNNGNETFTDINANLIGVCASSFAWGDYDNDGDLDILLMGSIGSAYITNVYRNDSNDIFSDINAELIGIEYGNVAFGDYDNDGDLDILGDSIYRNELNNASQTPTIPSIACNVIGGVNLLANNSIDDTTPNVALNYNYRVGTTPGGCQIISPLSNTTGIRKVSTYGNAYSGKYVLEYAPNTSLNMYVSAQAIDNSFAGSAYSNELHINTITPALQITYPNGGESLVSGTTSYIRWADNSVRSLNIKLTPNNGTSWIDITASAVPSAPGIHYYTVPSLNSTQCKMKIQWVKDGNYYDMSDAVFAIRNTSSQPLMNITYPSAGINTIPGRNLAITWTALNVSNVSLDYSIDNGSYWNNIVDNIPVSPATYTWVVPDSVSNQTRIRIRKADAATYYDVSDVFSICSLSLTSPNGGEIIQTDYSSQSTYNITWNADNISNIKIYYSVGQPENWQLISTTAGSSGYYRWTMPALESNLVKVKVIHAITTNIYDVSDNYFGLQIPVWFTNVNGGGFLNNYSSPTLRWRIQNYNPSTNVFVEFSPNQSTWTRLNTTEIPLGSLQYATWLDVGAASQIWFRMVQSNNNKILARSANPIAITSKYLAITSPNGGESWTVNSNQTIQWDADGCSNFNIDYTSNGGTTWSRIASNVSSTQFSYPWVIPNAISTQCRIKISDTTYSYMNLESDQSFTIAPFAVISPSGSFTADVTQGEMPLTVHFTESTNPGSGILVQRLWNFGDGATSNQANPTHIYTTAGTYTVSLYLQNSFDADATITMTDYITVLPNRPQIQLSTNIVNFGTVYLGNNSNQTMFVRNIGTAPLIISNMGWLNSYPAFSVNGFVPDSSVAAGDSLEISISFSPLVNGTVSDSLVVSYNSINQPIAKLKVIGTGQYVPPNPPANVNIVMNGYNAVLTWEAVTETIYNTPIVPDYYFVYYNGSADVNGQYYFHGLSTSTNYTHAYVGLAAEYMFYRVVAVKLYRDAARNFSKNRLNGSGWDIDAYLKEHLHTGMSHAEVEEVLKGL